MKFDFVERLFQGLFIDFVLVNENVIFELIKYFLEGRGILGIVYDNFVNY